MIIIIDYGLGNLASVVNALNKVETPVKISSSPLVIRKAKGIILPGVGAAAQGMKNLKEKNLDKVVIKQAEKGKPILGICLGMQLFLSSSEEGNVNCLNLIEGKVKKFDVNLKIPQIGWNQIKIKNEKLKMKNLFISIPDNSNFYFVNSYYCKPEDPSVVAATTDYGIKFCSVLTKDNILGVQFHPEKSGKVGLQLLKNWRDLC